MTAIRIDGATRIYAIVGDPSPMMTSLGPQMRAPVLLLAGDADGGIAAIRAAQDSLIRSGKRSQLVLYPEYLLPVVPHPQRRVCGVNARLNSPSSIRPRRRPNLQQAENEARAASGWAAPPLLQNQWALWDFREHFLCSRPIPV